MYAHIGRLAILHISTRTFISTFEREGCCYFRRVTASLKTATPEFGSKTPEFGSKRDFRVTASLKTVTPHLRSIVPNVQRHMAYFAKNKTVTPTTLKSDYYYHIEGVAKRQCHMSVLATKQRGHWAFSYSTWLPSFLAPPLSFRQLLLEPCPQRRRHRTPYRHSILLCNAIKQ
jgi:hypothetical protein